MSLGFLVCRLHFSALVELHTLYVVSGFCSIFGFSLGIMNPSCVKD